MNPSPISPESQSENFRSVVSLVGHSKNEAAQTSGADALNLAERAAGFLLAWGCPEQWAASALLLPVLDQVIEPLEPLPAEVVALGQRYLKLETASLPQPAERTFPESQAINRLRKLFIASYQDEAIIFLSLANMMVQIERLEQMAAEQQRTIAQELAEVVLPLLARYGLWVLKREVGERLFGYRHPEVAHRIAWLIAEADERRELICQEVVRRLDPKLPAGAQIQLHPIRASTIYEQHQEIARLDVLEERKDWLGNLVSQVAFDIVLPGEAECYAALGIIHSLWRPISNRFNDYIASPKYNGYRMLHTAVSLEEMDEIASEVAFFIGSQEMQTTNQWGRIAELQAGQETAAPLMPSAWWHKPRHQKAVENLEPGQYGQPTYVFSPVGQVYKLAAYSTPLDYAYSVHSDLGLYFRGAEVNGQQVAHDFVLANADIVRILIDPYRESRPRPRWLNIVRSATVAKKIRSHLTRQLGRTEHGRQLIRAALQERLAQHDLSLSESRQEGYIKQASRWQHFPDLESFFLAVSNGDVAPDNVANAIIAQEMAHRIAYPDGEPLKLLPHRVHLAQCCRPTVGEPIVGRFSQEGTEHERVKIHRASCPQIQESAIKALSWRQADYQGLFEYLAQGHDRERVLVEVLEPFYAAQAYLHKVQAERLEDGSAQFLLIAEPPDERTALSIRSQLSALPDIFNCTSRKVALSPSEMVARKKRLKQINPFYFYRPARYKLDFVGRTKELQKVQQLIVGQEPAGPIIVYGPWKTGKTSLLEFVAEHDRTEFNALSALVSCHEIPDLTLTSLLTRVAEALSTRFEKDTNLLGLYHTAFGEAERQELAEDPIQGFTRYLRRVRRLLDGEQNPRIVVLIDELSNLYDDVRQNLLSGVIFRNLRALVEKETDVRFIFVIQAAVIHEMQRERSLGAELLEGAQLVRLGPLDRQSAAELLKRRAKLIDLPCEQAVIEQVLSLSGCNPYVMNLLCYYIVEQLQDSGEPTITGRHLEIAIQNSLQEHAAIYFRHLTDLIHNPAEWQLMYLLSLSEPDTGGLPPDLIEESLHTNGSRPSPDHKDALNRLVDKGLVIEDVSEERGVRYRFQIPLMAKWFRDNRKMLALED